MIIGSTCAASSWPHEISASYNICSQYLNQGIRSLLSGCHVSERNKLHSLPFGMEIRVSRCASAAISYASWTGCRICALRIGTMLFLLPYVYVYKHVMKSY